MNEQHELCGVWKRKKGKTRIKVIGVYEVYGKTKLVFFRRRWGRSWSNAFDSMIVQELKEQFEKVEE